jgi:hypothetical protein
MSVIVRSHGGGCCGVFHISSFSQDFGGKRTDAMCQKEIQAALDRYLVTGNNNRLCEAVLTDNQCNRNGGQWPRVLRRMGFKLVARFRNSNSGNVCNVFHKINKPLSLEPENIPFEWGPPLTLAETFHRINRSGESPLVFDSLEAARNRSSLSRLVKIIKRVPGKKDETVWSAKPEVTNPFKMQV